MTGSRRRLAGAHQRQALGRQLLSGIGSRGQAVDLPRQNADDTIKQLSDFCTQVRQVSALPQANHSSHPSRCMHAPAAMEGHARTRSQGLLEAWGVVGIQPAPVVCLHRLTGQHQQLALELPHGACMSVSRAEGTHTAALAAAQANSWRQQLVPTLLQAGRHVRAPGARPSKSSWAGWSANTSDDNGRRPVTRGL